MRLTKSNLNGSELDIHGTLVQLSADLKGAHKIGGSMSAEAKQFRMKRMISKAEKNISKDLGI